MSEDEAPDLIAALDQAAATMRPLACLLAAHHAAMLAAGFGGEQALALTVAYQAMIAGTAKE